ncbi:type II toxin-antitoxin system VapC family toxin [Moorena sp. SIO4G3]|uniref:type II toxin-antitoxin system VapC family toxin n=1 Tax=Moorena sp. SIO4G3 TaxID=2607821 RepID=UPI00142B3B03|nr:type II toxin-antitoxin system VapC family toxin [Moorena sp. SIO4G3]NEO81574.1 type II toxin-antitoxin system VapC family toxin [Moorena sp. SIO4G3]
MKLLLDTHTLLWFDSEPNKLSSSCRQLLTNEDNLLLLSLASIWEIQIKSQIGRLNLRLPLSRLIVQQQQNIGLQILPISLYHVYALQSLPDVHRDPFDRIMVAQAMVENLPFVSIDSVLDGYPIQRIW